MGDDGATFEEFVLARQAGLYRAAFLMTGDRQLAEDLVQSSLERVYQHWRRVRAASNPDAYVRRIMVNLATDWWRSRRYASVHLAAVEHVSPGDPGHAEDVERRDQILRALRSLPPRMRAVLVLRYYEGLTETEAAAIMGCSVGTVKSQSSRALDRMRAVIDPGVSIVQDDGRARS